MRTIRVAAYTYRNRPHPQSSCRSTFTATWQLTRRRGDTSSALLTRTRRGTQPNSKFAGTRYTRITLFSGMREPYAAAYSSRTSASTDMELLYYPSPSTASRARATSCESPFCARQLLLMLSRIKVGGALRLPFCAIINFNVYFFTGKHEFSWAVMPHRGHFLQSKVPIAAYLFNSPLHGKLLPTTESIDPF